MASNITPTTKLLETKGIPMSKTLTAETAAKHVTESMQPVADFNAAANVKQPVPPAKTPLPAPLAKALGQS
jgi:hypothetical protein